MSELHDAALRAGVWSVVAARAKELADAAKTELAALEVGDTVAGKWDGKVIAKATMTKGRERIAVTDEHAFLAWVKRNHPTEVLESVNPAYVRTLKAVNRVVIDAVGEVPAGVSVEEGSPYVTVRKDKDAPFIVAQLLSSGALSLEDHRDWQAEIESGATG